MENLVTRECLIWFKTSLGSLEYSPVQFLYNSVNFTELVALYRIADVCLVTSARDGMNLVACEYIASQIGKHGVLVLSEFAGCSQSLNGKILSKIPFKIIRSNSDQPVEFK